MSGDADRPCGYKNPPKASRFGVGNVPHNKRAAAPDSLKEATARVFSAPRTVLIGDKPTVMSIRETLVREDIQKAINGNVSAIILIVNMMMDYPKLIEEIIEYRVFITGPAARL